MAGCGVVFGVFFAGGGGGVLFNASVRFCYRGASWLAIVGDRVAVSVAAP